MLCRNCYREIPDGTKFCPECGAPTEASANAAMGNNLQDQMAQSGFDPGNYERHTLGDIPTEEDGQTGQYDQGVNPQGQIPQGQSAQDQYPQGIPMQGQYQQPQYQQEQFGQSGQGKGQYQQGGYGQGQYPTRQTPNYQGSYQQVVPAKKKQSGMSVAAMILGILTCTAVIGFIIGLIDLIKNKDDGNTHGGSIFAVVWGGIILLAGVSNFVRTGFDWSKDTTPGTAYESSQDTSDYSSDGYDQSQASDDSSQRSVDSDTYSDSQSSDTDSQDQSSSDSGVVDPQLKAALDSYEEFMDEYIKFLKTYTQTSDPMAMLSEYTQYMTKYSELMQKISELDKMRDQMSAADLAYYIDWNARMQKKILEISNFN